MALDVEPWKRSLKDFYLDPKDNMWRKSDAYACAHSRHILILLILFEMCCAVVPLCTYFHWACAHFPHGFTGQTYLHQEWLKLYVVVSLVSTKKTKKQTCCTGPCESICIISRFKQLHLSKAMYLNSRVHRFTPSCRLLHSRAITIHSSSRSLCHYEPNCPGLAKSSLCSLLLLLLRNTPELWQMQRLLLAFKTSKIQAAATTNCSRPPTHILSGRQPEGL